MTWLSVGRVAFGRALPLLGAGAVIAACYSAGDGTAPPPNTIYFPVGLDVSVNGNVLYVANSDFDLQYNGGTIQSYDLNAIRTDVLKTIVNPSDPTLPFVRPGDADAGLSCTGTPPTYRNDGSGQRQPIGETCAPPMNSQAYVKASVTIGAFATPSYQGKKAKVLARDYSPEFSLSLALKDSALVVQLAHEAGLKLPVLRALVSEIEAAVRDGLGEGDLFGIERRYTTSRP